MFPTLIVTFAAAAAVLAVPHNAHVRRADHDVARSDWKNENLESYYRFRQRFKALDCASQRDTEFYTTCCFPLSAGESLDSRPAECNPTTCNVGAPTTPEATPEPNPAPTVDIPTYNTPVVEDEYELDLTPAPVNDDDLPYCDEIGLSDDDEYEVVEDTPAPATPEPAPATPEPAPEPAPETPAPSTGNGEVSTGKATWYWQNGNAGACGESHNDDEIFGAMTEARYGSNFGVKSSECGRRVRITNKNNGRSVDITIVDVCPSSNGGCGPNSIDLSRGAFNSIANFEEGQVDIDWFYI